jgi:hypothetical protein
MSLQTRIERLEEQATPARGWRIFNTHDGETFLERTKCVFDHQHDYLADENGEWPAFVKDKVMTHAQVDELAAQGWQIIIVRRVERDFSGNMLDELSEQDASGNA